ncbi:MAG: CHASE domain-containing protein [Thiogranum sp.]|nr:CHASE domain-containing protein [Thiogranum sp.]
MRRAQRIPLLVLLGGLLLSVVVAGGLHNESVEQTRRDFERAARDRAMALELGVVNGLLIGHSVAGLFAASQEVTREEFAAFSRFILGNTPYIRALQWAPRVMRDERDLFESSGRATVADYRLVELTADGRPVPAGQRDEYFPVHFVEPYQGNEAWIGFDLASDAMRAQALTYALEQQRPGTSGRVRLLRDAGATGVLTFLPAYRHTVPPENAQQRRESLLGMIVIVMDVPALVESSLAHLEPSGIDFTLTDASAPAGERFLYHRLSGGHATAGTGAAPAGASELSYAESLPVNNRRWVLEMEPAHGYFSTAVTLEVWLVFGGMLAATLLLAAYLNLLRQRELGLRRDRAQLEDLVAERTRDLENTNRELETFSYSIAHDLRAPLRAISGFSQILLEDSRDKLDSEEQATLDRVVAASNHMARLIDDILELARVNRGEVSRRNVDLSAMAHSIVERIETSAGERRGTVAWKIQDGVVASGDSNMLLLLLDNLLGNAWKYSAQTAAPQIEFGATRGDGEDLFYVRDNGIGFDMKYAQTIFGVFQRLHSRDSFEGTGIGLATVQRIVTRHAGRVWAESAPGAGATFFFSLGN